MENLTPAEKFVRNFYLEKVRILSESFNDNAKSSVAIKIKELGLNNELQIILKDTISQLLTDTFYTILLGLDGSASIGESNQESYIIIDECGNTISECGELEVAAYEYFYEDKYSKE